MKINLNLSAFESLPINLPLSSRIDFLILLIGMKPSVRIGPLSLIQIKAVCNWANKFDFYNKYDGYGYIFVSSTPNIDLIIAIDQSIDAHCAELGLLLGYPKCCSNMMAKVGENNIDDYEHNIVSNWRFEDKYSLIDPKGYSKGKALISHIPCSPCCNDSYNIAISVFNVIKKHRYKASFKQWRYLFSS